MLLDKFLTKSKKYLSKEEENNLFLDIEKNMNQIIKNNYKYMISICKHFFRNEVFNDEIIQVGLEGMVHAINKFDINKNIIFKTYAKAWIISSIQKFLYMELSTIRLPYNIYVNKHKEGYKYYEMYNNMISIDNLDNNIEVVDENNIIKDIEKNNLYEYIENKIQSFKNNIDKEIYLSLLRQEPIRNIKDKYKEVKTEDILRKRKLLLKSIQRDKKLKNLYANFQN